MDSVVFLTRHAMRHDRFDRAWRRTAKRSYDTPLHVTGFEQAHSLGRFLEDKEITHIFASPLLRAIQTAHIVAQHIGLSVKLEPALIEHLKKNWFPNSKPTGPNLMPLDEVIRHYPTVDRTHQSDTVLKYPESHEDVISRTKKICKKLVNEYGSGLLLVGHGRSIKRSVQYFIGYKSKVRIRPRCAGLYKVRGNNGAWSLEINNQPF